MENFINDIDASTGQISTGGSDNGTFDIEKLPEVLKTDVHTIPQTKVKGELFGTDLLLGYDMLEIFSQLNLYKLNFVSIDADKLVKIKGFPYLTSIWLTDGSPYDVKNFKGLDGENIHIKGSKKSIEKLIPKLCADPLELKTTMSVIVGMSPYDDTLILRSNRYWVPGVEYKFECSCKDIPLLTVCSQNGYEYISQQLGLNVCEYNRIGELKIRDLNFKGAYHGNRGTVIVLTTELSKETEIGCLDLIGIDVESVLINSGVYIRDIKGFEKVDKVGIQGASYEEIFRHSYDTYEDFRDRILKSVEEDITYRRKQAEYTIKTTDLYIKPSNPFWANDPNIFITKNYQNGLTLNGIDPIDTLAEITEHLTGVTQNHPVDLQACVTTKCDENLFAYDRADDRTK